MKKFNLKSKFLKSIVILTSGSILAQIIALVFSPIMTRLFTTEQIGEYTLLLTAVSMFGQVVALRYDVAIVTEKDEENVFSIVKLSVVLSFLLSFIISVGYAVSYIFDSLSFGNILFKTFFIFLLLFLTGLTNTLVSFNNRCREYGLITKVHVKRSLAKELVMTIGGLIHPHAMILAISHAVGIVFGVKEQSKSLYKSSDKLSAFKKVPFSKCKEMAVRHKKQALFSTPAIFANNFSYSSINIFIESLFGMSVLGLYSVSFRILGIPLTLISGNISKVYFEEAAREYNESKNYRKLFLKTSALLFAMAIPFVIVLMLLAPAVCALVFGKEYYMAGIYIRYLAPMFAIRLVVSPLTVGMQICQKQQHELLVQIMFIVSSVCAFIVSKTAGWSALSYLALISASFTVVYIVYYLYLFKISKSNKDVVASKK